MSEYVVVNVDWLKNNVDTVCCPERFRGDGFNIAPCNKDTDGDMECIDCWIKYGEGFKPLPPSAQFAGEMEEFLRKHFAEHAETEDGYYSCPKAENYFGHDEDVCYCGKDKADAILAKIAAAKEAGDEENITPNT